MQKLVYVNVEWDSEDHFDRDSAAKLVARVKEAHDILGTSEPSIEIHVGRKMFRNLYGKPPKNSDMMARTQLLGYPLTACLIKSPLYSDNYFCVGSASEDESDEPHVSVRTQVWRDNTSMTVEIHVS